jgi:hypothetical protein
VYRLWPRHLRGLAGLVLLLVGSLAGCDSPTPTPVVPPTATPEPPSTVALGTFDCGVVPGNPYEAQLKSCWRGKFNGAYVTVGAGHAGLSPSGESGDSQGVLVVVDGPDIYLPPAGGYTLYKTPQVVGSVRIRGVEGARVTLATADPNLTFVFDLQTRQWVTPQPGPVDRIPQGKRSAAHPGAAGPPRPRGAGYGGATMSRDNPPVLSRGYLRSPIFWLALLGLIGVTDIIPAYFALFPAAWLASARPTALMLGQITLIVVQAGALALALRYGRQNPPLRLGVLLGLLVADVVLPLGVLCAFLIALAGVPNM